MELPPLPSWTQSLSSLEMVSSFSSPNKNIVYHVQEDQKFRIILHPWLQRELEASQNYLRPYQNNKKPNKQK